MSVVAVTQDRSSIESAINESLGHLDIEIWSVDGSSL